jgi:DedD protein
MNQDPSALRRRARRRLVGAIAIALTAVVVVPMLFDPDPKPLGSDVDIRIPAQESPFEPDAAPVADEALRTELPAAPQTGQDPAPTAEPTPVAPKAPSQPVAKPADGAAVVEQEPPVAKVQPPKPEVKPASRPEQKPAPKPEPKPAPKLEAKTETKPPAPLPKPEPAFASRGYYLQLGAFSSAANANTLKARVADAGFKVEVADSNGQYRVRVGPIQDREQAQNTLAKLKAKGFSAVMIGP